MAMIKLVYVLQRREDVAAKDFHDYWLNVHAPKVRGHAAAIRARRYVQSHLVDTPGNEALRSSRGMLEPAPGITSIWWDSLEDFQAALNDPAGAAAQADLAEDEAKFIDVARSQIFLTEEHPIFDFAGGGKLGPEALKCTYLLARRADLTVEACHQTWLADHGPLVTSLAPVLHMARYIQSHTIAPAINSAFAAARGLAEPLDGITEVWSRPLAEGEDPGDPDARARGAAALVEDERRFVEMGRSRCFFTREHEIFDYR
jgi:heme-degrading monooxygenase HmoA